MRTYILLAVLALSACNHPLPSPAVISSEVSSQIDRVESLLDTLAPANELCVRQPSDVCYAFADAYKAANKAVVTAKKLLVVGDDAVAIAQQLAELGKQAARLLQSFANLDEADAGAG
mgnify:CR=1 FL=1